MKALPELECRRRTGKPAGHFAPDARPATPFCASLQENQQFDARPPILFLRSFNEDQVKLAAPKLSLLGRLVTLYQAKASLDILLLEEGIAYGPVVALGNPQDSLPPYGASRGYFLDEDWKKGVAKLVKDSQYIVICLDRTEGVLWEIDLVIALGQVSKTLFLVNSPWSSGLKSSEPNWLSMKVCDRMILSF